MIDKMLNEIFGTGLFEDIFEMVNQNIFLQPAITALPVHWLKTSINPL